ncbi:hypothetical protein B5F98_01625 [Pseudoflavonifractor sp. An44]|uniref:nucleotidyltransferase family protein n=1 Tax=Pseudoflavonifractor sp. An44 TaxID=1965635 RepID=UPI000B36A071|nr:nucleotidyltransferase family protein [Pseudoflavonifractor sp. An44]OUN99463.1 hypothetical protein B5F98_01625 [Pseudoflavonifractor sp. An44]
MRIACIVLAAGKSTRFGANKLLAPLVDRLLLEHTLEAIPLPCFSQVVAVVSDPEVETLCRRHGVKTVAYQGGPQSQSIRLGLEAIQDADGCLFVLGDQPLCSSDSIRRLVSDFQAQPKAVHRLAYQGQPSSPTLFPARLFPALKKLTGEHGGMAAVGDAPVWYTEAAGPQELWDADTPEKLSRIQQYLQAHP